MSLCMVLVLDCMTVFALADRNGTLGNLTWALDEEGTLTISGTGIMPDFGWNASDAWLSVKEDIRKVIIKEGVESIGRAAFYGCPCLQYVTMPHSIKSIGHSAFRDCCKLEIARIPMGVTYIGIGAFYECKLLTEIEIPDGVISIDNNAFFFCFLSLLRRVRRVGRQCGR